MKDILLLSGVKLFKIFDRDGSIKKKWLVFFYSVVYLKFDCLSLKPEEKMKLASHSNDLTFYLQLVLTGKRSHSSLKQSSPRWRVKNGILGKEMKKTSSNTELKLACKS